MSRRTTLAVRAAAAAALAVLTLASCSDSDDAPAADPGDIETSSQTDPGVTSTDGSSVVTTYQGVPPEFPVDQVPLLDEDDVVSGSETEVKRGSAYTVIIESDLPVAEARTEALGLLEDAGLTQAGEPADDLAPVALTGEDGDLFVLLTTQETDAGTLVTYDLDVA